MGSDLELCGLVDSSEKICWVEGRPTKVLHMNSSFGHNFVYLYTSHFVSKCISFYPSLLLSLSSLSFHLSLCFCPSAFLTYFPSPIRPVHLSFSLSYNFTNVFEFHQNFIKIHPHIAMIRNKVTKSMACLAYRRFLIILEFFAHFSSQIENNKFGGGWEAN